jgi:hypothetical protein
MISVDDENELQIRLRFICFLKLRNKEVWKGLFENGGSDQLYIEEKDILRYFRYFKIF